MGPGLRYGAQKPKRVLDYVAREPKPGTRIKLHHCNITRLMDYVVR